MSIAPTSAFARLADVQSQSQYAGNGEQATPTVQNDSMCAAAIDCYVGQERWLVTLDGLAALGLAVRLTV